MKVMLTPQVDYRERLTLYSFEGDIVKVTIEGQSDTFDFSGLPDGELELVDYDTGEYLIKTSLPVQPILSAKKKGGILYLELLNLIALDASEDERFPEWIDAKDYVSSEPEKVAPEKVAEEIAYSDADINSRNNKETEKQLENWSDF